MKIFNTFALVVTVIALASYSNIKSVDDPQDANKGILSLMTGSSAQTAAEAAAYVPLGYVVSSFMATHPTTAFALACAGGASALSEAVGIESNFSNYLNKMATTASALTIAKSGGLLSRAAAFGALTTPATAVPLVALFTVYATDKGLDYTDKVPSFLQYPAFKTFTNVLFKLLAAYTAYILIVNAR